MDYEILSHPDHHEVICRGTAVAADFTALIEALAVLAAQDPRGRVLVDETAVDMAPLSTADAEALARFCGGLREDFGDSRCAIVAPGDLVYGMNRMWSVHVSELWNVTFELFRDRGSALRWLLEADAG